MPVYDYKCSRCGAVFEKFVRAYDEEDKPHCPICDSPDTQKVVSLVSRAGDDAAGFGDWGYGCGTTRSFG